ncbi:DUF4347 domain-containing protein [Kamptonema formosum]|uniref:DUF4347 domain-containing protein n=1 Tax=Kamptonema formosum TaxID=331992 RepID=UPI0003450E32|nr:DUF4347 domain-containing protein [Oscillatoria sp. PCC 10802]
MSANFSQINTIPNPQSKTLVFIDAGVENSESLAAGVSDGAEAIILQPDRDGIEQITAGLQNYASAHGSIDAVHIFSHGSPGHLQLGNTSLNSDTLQQYKSQLQQWRDLLADSADILLYGCDVAAGDGAKFVSQLSNLTGADIAASADLTGSAAAGGNWNLEFQQGEIETPLAFQPDVMAQYPSVAGVTVVGTGTPESVTEAALTAALAAGGTITFNTGGAPVTLTLTSEKLISENTVIDGGGSVTLSGGNTTRLFRVATGKSLTVKNLTLTGAHTPEQGGAILTEYQGSLTAENCHFTNNVARKGGGAIFGSHASTVTVTGSTFDSNDGTGDNDERGAGAIAVRGSTLAVSDCDFTNNRGINGAAINSLTSGLTVENCKFTHNDTTAGAVDDTDPVGFIRGVGGAIYTDLASDINNPDAGTIRISNSLFDGNKAAGEGGAAQLYAASPDQVILENSTFVNNSVTKDSKGNRGNGGAVRQGNAPLTVSNCTFANNVAATQGGGLWVGEKASVNITNSTFSGNRAEATDYTGDGGGIAIATEAAYPTTIANTTIANNYAGWVGGGLVTQNQPVTLKNTIFANNTAGNPWSILQHSSGQLTDGGNNLQYPAKLTDFFNDANVTPNITIADPLLGPLQDNGGPTPTHALLAGSPAINAGATAEPLDQRGVTRVSPDIGAFEQFQVEFASTASSSDEPASGSATANIQVKLSQALNFDLSVPYTVAGSATTGTDFTALSGAVVVPAGSAAANIPLQILADSAAEPAETVVLTLTPPAGGTYLPGANTAHTHTISASGSVPANPNQASVTTPQTDNIDAAGGDDTVTSSWANLQQSDSVDGGAGADTFVLTGGTGSNSVTFNLSDAARQLTNISGVSVKNFERLDLSGFAGSASIAGAAAADWISGGAGSDTILGGAGDDTLAGSSGNDILLGGDNCDSLLGNQGSDLLFGNAGADSLDGGEGSDTLYGGKDSDALTGGAGDDLLSGDLGGDTLTGSQGSDKFILTSGKGSDIITDFLDGADFLALAGGLTFGQLSVSAGAGATSISIAGTGELLASLVGVSANLIGVADFTAI